MKTMYGSSNGHTASSRQRRILKQFFSLEWDRGVSHLCSIWWDSGVSHFVPFGGTEGSVTFVSFQGENSLILRLRVLADPDGEGTGVDDTFIVLAGVGEHGRGDIEFYGFLFTGCEADPLEPL